MSGTIRVLINLAFAYTCIEGLVVNITYPNVLAYIIKDVVLGLAYLALVTEQRPAIGTLKQLGAGVMGFSVLTFFFLMMPTPVTMLAALVAVKQRLFYIPLIYVGYFYTRTERDLYSLVKLMAWTAIPTALFGIYLFFAGPEALRSIGGTYSAIIHSTMGSSGVVFWRVPGSFTSPGQFSLYLLIQATVMTGFLFVPDVNRLGKLIPLAALVLSLGAMFVSGTRTPLIMYVLCVGAMLLYMGKLTRLGAAAVVLYAILAFSFSYFGAGVQDRVGSILSQENLDRARTTAFGQLFYAQMLQTPLGMGLGTATIGARHFTDWDKVILIESYFGLIVAETGVLGLLVFSWFMARITLLLINCRAVVARAAWNPLWYAIVLLLLEIVALMPSNTVIDSAPGNMYFWFLIGVSVRLADIARARQPATISPQMMPGLATQYAFNVPGPAGS